MVYLYDNTSHLAIIRDQLSENDLFIAVIGSVSIAVEGKNEAAVIQIGYTVES